MSYTEINKCRLCGNPDLTSIIHLGEQYLGGVFPKDKGHLGSLERGPLELVKCNSDAAGHPNACDLLQLRQSYDPDVMFTNNKYGYLSSLNKTMTDHLHKKVRTIIQKVSFNAGDLFVDIGSNDATLLRSYPQKDDIHLVGFDPGGDKFRKFYPAHIHLINDFFSAKKLRYWAGDRKVKAITSIAMFYDIEDPMWFMRQVHDVLADDGIWITEQGYMPKMLEQGAYDAICHEHLEYYGLKQIKWMADRAGFRILDVEMNEINGGSFEVTLGKASYPYRTPRVDVDALIAKEPGPAVDPYLAFAHDVELSRRQLRAFFDQAGSAGALICGLGASTKGNTLLQYCGITAADLPFIGEVNSDKFGSFTPGTQIPIIPEQDVLAMKPDYLLVLPWHFRSFFENNPSYAGLALVFPLPRLTILR